MKSWLKANIKRKDEVSGGRDAVRGCRNRIRTAKAHLGLNLSRDVKANKKGFCK